MIQAAPVGTLKHRNYTCPALEQQRARHAPLGMRYKATLDMHSSIAMERALMPGISHIVPLPSKVATFLWALEPPGGLVWGRVYTDGSRLDGPTALLARNGWAFVAVNEDDETFAIAYGVPPRLDRRHPWH